MGEIQAGDLVRSTIIYEVVLREGKWIDVVEKNNSKSPMYNFLAEDFEVVDRPEPPVGTVGVWETNGLAWQRGHDGWYPANGGSAGPYTWGHVRGIPFKAVVEP